MKPLIRSEFAALGENGQDRILRTTGGEIEMLQACASNNPAPLDDETA
jgi:hypothetical protein